MRSLRYESPALQDALNRAYLDLLAGKALNTYVVNELIFQLERYVQHGGKDADESGKSD